MDKKKNCIAVTPDVINDIAISDDNNGQKNISQDISLLSDISLFRNKIPIRHLFALPTLRF